MKSPSSPNTVTIRRNPPRRARPTPSSTIPLPLPLSSTIPSSISKNNIPSFPIEDILSIELPENTSQPKEQLAENLKVFLRIRPLSTNQSSTKKKTLSGARKNASSNKNAPKPKPRKKTEVCLKINDSHSVTICPPQSRQDQKRNKSVVYEGFSHVFSAEASQDEVYEKMVNPIVEDFLRGKSGMLAALGPSGSGKTHTIFGSTRQPGMVPLALRWIFWGTKDSVAQSSRAFYLSMFEISSEQGKSERILDLCKGGGDKSMQQSTIKGLQEAIVCDARQAETLIAQGMMKRATAMTNSNNQSSRSQCVINIRSETHDEVNGQSHSALLTIVDLAGAEREKRTGNQGARLLESNFINNTSMVFGLCLRSLLEHQKYPNKPLQKHFQNSMLTRYLRDYLEGKKRMALILTVKSGEEDYLDASFLLRQASPYTKIKFNNSEEPSGSVHNKRQLQPILKADQLKRLKISTCEVNDGKAYGVNILVHKEGCLDEVRAKQVEEVEPSKDLAQSTETMKVEVCEDTSFKDSTAELSKRDRESQIMQDIAKAMWKVLKQYKEKIKVAEKEICCLRESLTIEKVRSSELENAVNHLKSYHSRQKKISEETLVEVVESREEGFAKLEGYQSSDSHEVGGVSSVHLNKFEYTEHKKSSDSTVRDLGVASTSCVGGENFNQQSYQSDKSPGFSEDLEDPKGREDNQLNCRKSDLTSCSGAEKFTEQIYGKCDYSPGKVDNVDDLEDKCSIGEGTGLTSSLGGESYKNFEEQSYEVTSAHQKDNDSPGHIVIVEDEDHTGRQDAYSTGKATGTVLLEDVVNSSQHVIIKDNSSSVGRDQSQIQAKKKLLDQAVMFEEDISSSRACNVINKPESATKFVSCSKPLNAGKPKRRLQPASSILLKNINGLDVEDENEKPKGTKGEKKMGLDVTRRTQGDISLIRLLQVAHNL